MIAQKNPEDSPRLGSTKQKIITGILTQRDINCFDSDNEKVKNKMTSIEKLIYY